MAEQGPMAIAMRLRNQLQSVYKLDPLRNEVSVGREGAPRLRGGTVRGVGALRRRVRGACLPGDRCVLRGADGEGGRCWREAAVSMRERRRRRRSHPCCSSSRRPLKTPSPPVFRREFNRDPGTVRAEPLPGVGLLSRLRVQRTPRCLSETGTTTPRCPRHEFDSVSLRFQLDEKTRCLTTFWVNENVPTCLCFPWVHSPRYTPEVKGQHRTAGNKHLLSAVCSLNNKLWTTLCYYSEVHFLFPDHASTMWQTQKWK